jgi:hypothetical protein
MNSKIVIWALLPILQSSCNTSDEGLTPSLPAITMTGENTFGCYIDGTLLIPRSGSGTTSGPDPGLVYSAGPGPTKFTYNEINVQDFKSGTGGLMDIHLVDLETNGDGTFPIDESNCEKGIYANISFNIRCRLWDQATEQFKWFCSVENGGVFTITRYDFENRIIAGTFHCQAVNRDDANDSIEITDGRFDINWGTLSEYTEFP